MTDTYRPGDFAEVANAKHPDGVPAVCMPNPGSPTQHWLDMHGRMLRRPLTIGPVLGNVSDIVAGIQVAHIRLGDGVSLQSVRCYVCAHDIMGQHTSEGCTVDACQCRIAIEKLVNRSVQ